MNMALAEDELSTDSAKKVLGILHGLMDAFVKGIRTKNPNSNPPASYLSVFCLVAMNEGLSVEEYAQRAKVSKSTMSRHLLNIGDRDRKMKPGLGLVTARPNLHDRRQREYFLTNRGRVLAEKIARLHAIAKDVK
jgi:DNA-binding MarR family transcriptional regulator